MAQYSCIEDITPLTENMTIKIRIIRLWKPPSFVNPNNDGSIEMVFIDEKGGKIQASVKNKLIRRFSDMLAEGSLRAITNFGVGQNIGDYKATKHPYKINFYFSTNVRVCENLPISLHGFNFVPFDDILSNELDDKVLIDVIGEIVAVGSLEVNEKNGRTSRKLMLELNDNKGGKMKCTLWDTYAVEASDFLAGRDSRPIVIIIQFAKIKEWKGEKTLSNSLFSTRLFLDDDIAEIDTFKESLEMSSENASAIQRVELSNQNSVSITDEFLHLHEKKTLDDIREIASPTSCITLATIICVQLEHGWYYIACKKCNKKVSEDGENVSSNNSEPKITKFWCKKCNKSIFSQQVIPRFKVQVRVIDESGSASFVMFDREVMSIINKTAYELKESLTESNDMDTIPELLMSLEGKRFLFKLEVSDYNIKQNWQVYTITKLSDSEELMQSYLGVSTVNQNVDLDVTTTESNGASKRFIQEKDSNSCIGDNDQPSELTPVSCEKKRAAEVDSSDHGMQFSATKKILDIKIEKDVN